MRKKYIEDEKKYIWLPILLDVYYSIDSEYEKSLKEESKKRGQRVVCERGCSCCCIEQTVPITQLELQGISWYVIERLEVELRNKIKVRLLNHKEIKECPFLIDEFCSIYEMRPIACRSFFVFNKKCTPNEDVLKQRSNDIFFGNRSISQKAAWLMLPYYGFLTPEEKAVAFEDGFIMSVSRPMHTFDWKMFGKSIR
jgi:Fe-S-cluster containining protein